MKNIDEAPIGKGVKVLLRADLNVPIKNGLILEPFRIESVLPTIRQITEKGAILVLISHIESEDNNSLEPVFNYIKKEIKETVFVKNYRNVQKIINEAKDGSVIMLENLRINQGEKKNDLKFAKELSSLGDLFIFDAFSVAHREHASVVGLPKYLPSYVGPLMKKEIDELSKVFISQKPLTVIIGGAKFDTKIPLIEKFLEISENIIVVGALAHDLFRAQGLNIGKSKYSETEISLQKYINNKKIILPIDAIVTSSSGDKIKNIDNIKDDECIVDAGPQTIANIKNIIQSSKTILWNGPLGFYENGYDNGTKEIALAIISNSSIHSIIGGGDTVAVISKLSITDKFSFVSTGGGAMLDFLAKGTLPAIEALNSDNI